MYIELTWSFLSRKTVKVVNHKRNFSFCSTELSGPVGYIDDRKGSTGPKKILI